MNKSVLFFGTPQFAADILEGICNAKFSVLGVISMPDRPQGRGYQLSPTPVKVMAIKQGIAYYQPENSGELEKLLKELPPFLGLVVAYGMILPPTIVRSYDLVNLHASILPKYRGASPIQAALLNGEKKTGASLMRIDNDVDAGNVIACETVPILHEDNAQSLADKLVVASVSLFVRQYNEESAPWAGTPQNHTKATHTRRIRREDGLVELRKESPLSIYRKWQAYNPWPGIYINDQGKRIKLLDIDLVDGQLLIRHVQIEGKSKVAYLDYVRGNTPLI